ncbi:hypothetical protein LINGRAHAP2_LOCUS29021 [Linum grandiflorum]
MSSTSKSQRKWAACFVHLKKAMSNLKLKFDFGLHCFTASLHTSSSSSDEEEEISFCEDWPRFAAACQLDYDPDDDQSSDSDSVWYSPQAYFADDNIDENADDNVDDKAEIFIRNFRRQLQIERQISVDRVLARKLSASAASMISQGRMKRKIRR